MSEVQIALLFATLDTLVSCCQEITQLMTVQLCFFAIMTGILFFIGHRTGGLFALVLAAGLVGGARTSEAGEPYHSGTPELWSFKLYDDVGGFVGDLLHNSAYLDGYPQFAGAGFTLSRTAVSLGANNIDTATGHGWRLTTGGLSVLKGASYYPETTPGSLVGLDETLGEYWNNLVGFGGVHKYTVYFEETCWDVRYPDGTIVERCNHETWPDGNYTPVEQGEGLSEIFEFTPHVGNPVAGAPAGATPRPAEIPTAPPAPDPVDPPATPAPPAVIVHPNPGNVEDLDLVESYLDDIRRELLRGNEALDDRVAAEHAATRDQVGVSGQHIVDAVDLLRTRTVELHDEANAIDSERHQALMEGTDGVVVPGTNFVESGGFGGEDADDLTGTDDLVTSVEGITTKVDEIFQEQMGIFALINALSRYTVPAIGQCGTYSASFGTMPVELGGNPITLEWNVTGLPIIPIVRAHLAFLFAFTGMMQIVRIVRDSQL